MEKLKNRILVMGDIHGAYAALKQFLIRSGFDYEKDTLIQLGDVVDGHNQSFECVEELLKIKNMIAIRGNHDYWFQIFIETDYHPELWNYGANSTAASYIKHLQKEGVILKTQNGFKTSLNNNDIPHTHKAFFKNQKSFFIDEENRCFLHAGFNTTKQFHEQDHTEFFFNRSFWLNAWEFNRNEHISNQFSEIFIGHTPTTNWGYTRPLNVNNIWNLDTGASDFGRLSIMDLRSKEYWQSDELIAL